MLVIPPSAGGVYIAREQYSSLGEDMEEGVQVRVQVEVGREEVGDREKHGERQNEEATRNRRSNAHLGWHGDGMTRAHTLEPCSVMHINYEV